MKVSARLHHHDYVRPQRRNGVRVILNHTGYCCFFCVFIFCCSGVHCCVCAGVILSAMPSCHPPAFVSLRSEFLSCDWSKLTTLRLQVIVNNFIIVTKGHNCSSTFAVFYCNFSN